MASLNQVNLIGYLGDAPKMNILQNGGKVATFSLATTEKGYTKQDGSVVPDKTEWHNVVLWNKLAEIAGKFLTKGSLVYIQGKLQTTSYENQQGQKLYSTKIIAETMQMLSGFQPQQPQQPQYPQPRQPQQYPQPQQPQYPQPRQIQYPQGSVASDTPFDNPQQEDLENDLPF